MNNYQMGGVGIWHEMTDISFFLIDNDIDKYSKDYMPNAFHRNNLGRGAIFIALRFLQGGGDYFIDENSNMTNQFASTERVLAHEIGHNIFNKFIDNHCPYYPIALSRAGIEWTADQFSWSIGISPYHYNNASRVRRLLFLNYSWNPTGTDNDYYDSILNHYNKYLGN
jgi:hypothetical protein